ncbi:MAG: PQQ-binding-like beta-propeller repeat protein [Planctomycetota bacterium]
MRRILCASLLVLTSGMAVGQDSGWTSFRNGGQSHAAAEALPLTWSSESLAWRVTVPGQGQSSPVIHGDRVFVTSTSGPQKETLFVSCLELSSGQVLWRRELSSSHPEELTDMRSKSAPTPLVDGERVYAFFESGDLFAFDHRGETQWHRDLAKDLDAFQGNHGLGTSPAWSEAGVLICLDHEGPSLLMCLDHETGDTLWKTTRKSRSSWTSPIVTGDQVVVSSNGSVDAYAVASGERLWSLGEIEGNTVASATPVGEGFLIASSAKAFNLFLSIGAEGGPTVRWRAEEVGASGFASPVANKERAFWVAKSGVLYCIDLKSGESIWRHRLPDSAWATPILGAGRLYIFCVDGTTIVLDPTADEPRVLATNAVPTETRIYGVAATEGTLILRTETELVAVRQ